MTVAIVGAGLGGLVLARMLHVNGIDAAVYERESSRGARGQGGMLDLHSGTGQRALREAGLIDQFNVIARPEGQDLRLLEPDDTLLLQHDTPDDAPLERPEVDRADLRDLLLDSLPEHMVRWGRAFARAGNDLLHFTDGSSATYDLLVGADGADSRVRRLLTDVRPAHTGQNVVELGIPDIDRTHPDLAAMVGRGSYWVLGNGQSLSAQRNGDGRVRVYLSFYNTAEDWFAASGIPFGEPAAARTRLIDLLAGWNSKITALIAACDDTIVPRSIATLPVGLTWPSTAGVTLLGDAAHLMPPVGQGANMAMLDGALLGLALAAHPDDFPSAVKEYECEMFERTSAAARQSARTQEILTSPNASQTMLAFFQPGHQAVTLYGPCMSHYFAFVALMAVLVLIPGPAVILVMKRAMTTGYRGALRVAAGVFTADLVWAAAAAAGVSAVIVASQPAFLALRIAGAAYLIYLGARLLLAPKGKVLPAAPADDGENETVPKAGHPRAFRQGFLCDMTNPKTLLVFTSVLPQFVPAGASPFQPALLGITFAALGFASLALYSVVLARAGGVIRRPKLTRRLIRGSGGVLVGFGVALVAER